MNRGEISVSITTDLITEIFSRLPAKSIARFRCVSKLWGSMLRRPYFTELFLTRSRARPRLFFALEKGDGEWSFYSSPQNPGHGLVHTRFHMKFSQDTWPHFRCLTSGLIYFSDMHFSNIRIPKRGDMDTVPVICNPSTGHYAVLPTLTSYMSSYVSSDSFLGFDPVDNQFKVLFMGYPFSDEDHKILTLETGKLRWRKIKCPLLSHYPLCEGICINGVLYYLARFYGDKHSDYEISYMIVCFDVRSETFKFIKAEGFFDQLINYKGKIGGIRLEDADAGGIELSIWVLEDFDRREWLENVYTLCDEDKVLDVNYLSIVGMTSTGEIILSKKDASKPFYVFYFNPDRNTSKVLRSKVLENLTIIALTSLWTMLRILMLSMQSNSSQAR